MPTYRVLLKRRIDGGEIYTEIWRDNSSVVGLGGGVMHLLSQGIKFMEEHPYARIAELETPSEGEEITRDQRS